MSNYMGYGEAVAGIQGRPSIEVVQDLRTSFFVLLGILFPTFTDIVCGANLSGACFRGLSFFRLFFQCMVSRSQVI